MLFANGMALMKTETKQCGLIFSTLSHRPFFSLISCYVFEKDFYVFHASACLFLAGTFPFIIILREAWSRWYWEEIKAGIKYQKSVIDTHIGGIKIKHTVHTTPHVWWSSSWAGVKLGWLRLKLITHNAHSEISQNKNQELFFIDLNVLKERSPGFPRFYARQGLIYWNSDSRNKIAK